jgi:hypothetical protein
MSNTESTDLQQGDKHAYEAMAKATQTSVSELIEPFKTASNAEALLRVTSAEDFFQKFLIRADHFTDRCCQEYSKIVRECTIVPDVRGTPTTTLAKQIRAEVFEPLDRILAGYVQSLKQLGFDMGALSAGLRESSVIDAAMRGAAVGQVAGGFGNSGKTLGALNALLQAGAEAEKKLALLQQRVELLRQAEFITYGKIAEYLEAVIGLPERLLDYGCAKCFGGQVSLEHQRKTLEDVQTAIAQELEPAVKLTLALPEAAKRLEQERLDAAKVHELENQKRLELESKKPAPGKGLALLVLAIGLVVWAFTSCDVNTANEEEMIWGLILMIGALFAFIAGVMKFFDRRPKAVIVDLHHSPSEAQDDRS